MNLTDIFVNKLRIDPYVQSIDVLFDEGRVRKTEYNPPYQRNYVWDSEKATYFLESILIGTEIPPLIFFRSGNKVEIIDGRQRYETILKFLRGDLKLRKSGLRKLDVLGLDKMSFSDLPKDLRDDFLDTTLRIIEYSFHSHEGLTQHDEDMVKQEIFKRYNSGITPLKEFEIDKAIYFEDDLNAFFKDKFKNLEFHDLFTTLFKYEDKKVEVSLKKIRQLLVLHKIPIRYYSVAKQKVTDKYYDLLSSQIREEEFDDLFRSFRRKLFLIDIVRNLVEMGGASYNRLISETLFWAFSIMEDNGYKLQESDTEVFVGFANHIIHNINAFEMDRSSFANQILNRFSVIAYHIKENYPINMKLYIETSDEFKQQNRELSRLKGTEPVNYQELRINKLDASSKSIDDICRQMNRHRFLVRPPYQREEVINKQKSSEIIESLLLGIKLPPIFIYKNEEGVSEVIDGQQRILSILAYLGRGYMDENGNEIKTNKDNFALQLKDSILTYLDKKKFQQLSEVEQDKITNFGLWVIEINERNNPSFEPLDLFIRLNNKPYPIKSDTFEMWNSYLDRGLINTIKASYGNCASWFFMRKMSNRMDNENNYTVLSYFNYLEQNPQEGSEKEPYDIYKVGSRIAFRLRSKRDIGKILEDANKKDAFVQAVNNFEFTFIANLRMLLTEENDDSDKMLSKKLDEVLGVENGKRTQQSFYVLWYFLKGLDGQCISNNRNMIRKEVRQLFGAMSKPDLTIEEFDGLVKSFRAQYEKKVETDIIWSKMEDLLGIYSFDPENSVGEMPCDFYVKRNNKMNRRVEILFERPKKLEDYNGCKLKRLGFTKGYIAAVIQSNYVFKEYDFANRNVVTSSLKNIELPMLPLHMQLAFDKVMAYAQTDNKVQKMFFESILDRLVDEVYHQESFKLHDFSLFKRINELYDLNELEKDEEKVTAKINEVYDSSVNGENGLLSDLSVATGITGTVGFEKDK